jgi:hypothetical protein
LTEKTKTELSLDGFFVDLTKVEFMRPLGMLDWNRYFLFKFFCLKFSNVKLHLKRTFVAPFCRPQNALSTQMQYLYPHSKSNAQIMSKNSTKIYFM